MSLKEVEIEILSASKSLSRALEWIKKSLKESEEVQITEVVASQPAPAVDAYQTIAESHSGDKEYFSKKEWHERFVKISLAASLAKSSERVDLLKRLKVMIEDAIKIMLTPVED